MTVTSLQLAEQALRGGDPDAALKTLQDQVRQNPSDAKLRVFLFQLLCVVGQRDRALTQLNVAAELDPGTLAMAQMYREALQCESLRAEVFAGKKSPVIFGEPPEWMALLIESLLVRGTERSQESTSLRARAFEAAPPTPGSIDGQPFEWIADADMRLGPVCEAVINGRYYWVPFDRLSRIDLEAPADLRDVVWMPAHFQFSNGGESVGLIPTRYAGSESSGDAQVRLARKTEWREDAPEVFVGLGQRVLATDVGEHPIMDVRTIELGAPAASDESSAHA
jgi:type VI secretion system protein ImpE